MTHYYTIPGYLGSGPTHWQTWLENNINNISRIEQANWEEPNINEWAAQIDFEIKKKNKTDIVLIAHSFGCLAVAQWAKKYTRAGVKALLVAPPDISKINKLLKEPVSQTILQTLEFDSILISSTNDHWLDDEKAKLYAQKWGSQFVSIGDAGHINTESGFGPWQNVIDYINLLEK